MVLWAWDTLPGSLFTINSLDSAPPRPLPLLVRFACSVTFCLHVSGWCFTTKQLAMSLQASSSRDEGCGASRESCEGLCAVNHDEGALLAHSLLLSWEGGGRIPMQYPSIGLMSVCSMPVPHTGSQVGKTDTILSLKELPVQ